MPFHLDNRFWKKIRDLQSKIWRPRRPGFTLIELLVVIAIIGILASFAIASFTSAQAKGRDSRRKSDLDAIKKALELVKTDSTGDSWYPNCTTGLPACTLESASSTSPNLSATYIKSIPKDPTGTYYLYIPNGCTGSSTCSGYSLTACLENANDRQGTFPGTSPCTASQANYTVTNP